MMCERKEHKEDISKQREQGKMNLGNYPLRCMRSNVIQFIEWVVYCVSVIDEFSKKTWIYFLKIKDEVFNKFKEFKSLIKNHTENKIKTFRSDNGEELTLNGFKDLCKDLGIKRELTTPYNPKQNMVTKRKNRTIMEASREMIHD